MDHTHLPAVPASRTNAAPWFFASPAQRLQWARLRFFEEGVRPTGLVSEAVIQSWTRCLGARIDPARMPSFDPVSPGRVRGLHARSQRLMQAAEDELRQLDAMLADTPAVSLLLNAQGMVLRASRTPGRDEGPLLAVAARPGVDLSEARIGTNAPALAAASGTACAVLGAEHFAQAIGGVHCAAAAIRGPDDSVVGVLDLSTEGVPFGFDAAQVVEWHARAIEQKLLLASPGTAMVMRLHLQPSQLDGAMVGMAGTDDDGRLAWCNATARAILGSQAQAGAEVETVLGLQMAALRQLASRGSVRQVPLPNGLRAWLQVDPSEQAWDDAAPSLPRPSHSRPAAAQDRLEPAGTAALRDSQRDLVLRTLLACDGNVAAAARMLGVSRGLVYRQCKPGGSPVCKRP